MITLKQNQVFRNKNWLDVSPLMIILLTKHVSFVGRHIFGVSPYDAGASINTPNIGNSALMIEELDWGGQDALNTCKNSFFGPHLGLGRQKNVIILGQTPDVKLPY